MNFIYTKSNVEKSIYECIDNFKENLKSTYDINFEHN